MRIPLRLRLAALVAVALVGAVAAPPAAHAWWRGGFGFGFVPFAPYPYAYPYYYPPPVVYAPPVYAAPPAAAEGPPASAGPACYAGPYVCPLRAATPVGAPCSCPTNDNGRMGGRVG
jgi:hypothetical protein